MVKTTGSSSGCLRSSCGAWLHHGPTACVLQNPAPNAYTLAVQGRKPFITVTTALLDLLEPEEVQAVMGAHPTKGCACT